MKKRSYIGLIIGSITSLLTIGLGILSFFIENNLFFASLALFLAGAVSLIGSLVGFWYHDRFGGIIVVGSSALYFFALSILNSFYSDFLFFHDIWINVLVLLFVLGILVTALLYIYRMPSKEKQNHQNNYFTLIGTLITITLFTIFIVQQIKVQYYLSSIACLVAIILLIGGLLISFLFKTHFGSLVMTMSLWFAFFGVVVVEVYGSNFNIVVILLAQTMLVTTILLEWFDIISAQEKGKV